jgi:hypothetical protein
VDTFEEAPDVATPVEEDFELLEHALKTTAAAPPVTTRPIAILRIGVSHLSIADGLDSTIAAAWQQKGIYECCIAVGQAVERPASRIRGLRPPVADGNPGFRSGIGVSHKPHLVAAEPFFAPVSRQTRARRTGREATATPQTTLAPPRNPGADSNKIEHLNTLSDTQ